MDVFFEICAILLLSFQTDTPTPASTMKLRSRGIGADAPPALPQATSSSSPNSPNSSTAVAPSAFTYFPRLPQELKDKIWKLAMEDASRVVEMQVYTVKGWPRHYWTDAQSPAILRTSHDARKAGLELYNEDWTVDEWSNNHYDEECGTHADAGERMQNYGWGYLPGDPDFDVDRTGETFDCCPRPARDHRNPHDHPIAPDCPVFLHKINFKIDILYLRKEHCTTKEWYTLLDLSPSQPVERAAIGFDSMNDDDFFLEMWRVLSWPELREVFLVFGDVDCCNPSPSGHKRIKEFSTNGVVIPAELNQHITRFEEEFREYWLDVVYEDEDDKDTVVVPTIIKARAIREA